MGSEFLPFKWELRFCDLGLLLLWLWENVLPPRRKQQSRGPGCKLVLRSYIDSREVSGPCNMGTFLRIAFLPWPVWLGKIYYL